MSSFRTWFAHHNVYEINRFPRQLKINITTEHIRQVEDSLWGQDATSKRLQIVSSIENLDH